MNKKISKNQLKISFFQSFIIIGGVLIENRSIQTYDFSTNHAYVKNISEQRNIQ